MIIENPKTALFSLGFAPLHENFLIKDKGRKIVSW